MDQEAVIEAAKVLHRARSGRRRIDALPTSCRPRTVDDGYRIQDALVELIGAEVAGWKIGSTSRKAQALVGSDGPLAARLLSPNVYVSPATVPADACFMRALEAEFAFRLCENLPRRPYPYTLEEVLVAVDLLYPAIEISDSRYSDWTQVGAPSLVADNTNDGAFVLGPSIGDWRDFDLSTQAVGLSVNGRLIAQGTGGDVIGGPQNVLMWLANDRMQRGDGLQAGHIVTTGTCTGVVMAEAQDNVVADFGDLGSVELKFS